MYVAKQAARVKTRSDFLKLHMKTKKDRKNDELSHVSQRVYGSANETNVDHHALQSMVDDQESMYENIAAESACLSF